MRGRRAFEIYLMLLCLNLLLLMALLLDRHPDNSQSEGPAERSVSDAAAAAVNNIVAGEMAAAMPSRTMRACGENLINYAIKLNVNCA